MILSCDAICILFWNAPKSKFHFRFHFCFKIRLITCFSLISVHHQGALFFNSCKAHFIYSSKFKLIFNRFSSQWIPSVDTVRWSLSLNAKLYRDHVQTENKRKVLTVTVSNPFIWDKFKTVFWLIREDNCFIRKSLWRRPSSRGYHRSHAKFLLSQKVGLRKFQIRCQNGFKLWK